MDSTLPGVKAFLRDKSKENLILYELEFNTAPDPNADFRARAKSEGNWACRLWFIIPLANLIVFAIFTFFILLALLELGAVPPYRTYGQQCTSGKCDPNKVLTCTSSGSGSKTCQCPSGNWYWYNGTKCRECPPNWRVSSSGTDCYFISTIRLNYTDANLWCVTSNSHLLEIADQNAFLTMQSVNQFSFILNSSYWIGLRETGSLSYTYRWITSGSAFSRSDWFCSGQPANAYNYYFQQYDQCIGLYIQTNTSTCLRDSTCPNVAPFICQLY